MRIAHTVGVGVGVFLALVIATTGCSKKAPLGSCEVAFDDLGAKGDACTQVREDQCSDGMQPAISSLASTKKKNFTAGKLCQDLGYAKSCPNVPIAWSLSAKSKCP
jgi:hypothetical protein